jgi:hypothetical protein
MSKRIGHPLVVAALVGILVLLPVAGLATLPRWTLDLIPFGRPGEGFQPVSWSPDGTRFLFQQLNQFLVVRVGDGAVLRVGYGDWPVWVDDDTIDSVQDIGMLRSQVSRVSLSTGRGATIVPQLGNVKLIGRGVVDLAATGNIGDIETTIVDPIDGRKIAHIPGVRAIDWVRPGVLIGKTANFELQGIGDRPGSLVVWTLRDGARPIGPDLLDVRDLVAPAPTGDAIACVCALLNTGAAKPPEGIYRVPLDGSAATRLADVIRANTNNDPVVSRFEDGSIVFLDGAGLHRIGPDGANTAIPVDPGDLPPKGYYGRAFPFGNAIVLASQLGIPDTVRAKLTIMSPSGEVGYRQTFASWIVGLILDPVRLQALVYADQRFFVLRRQ